MAFLLQLSSFSVRSLHFILVTTFMISVPGYEPFPLNGNETDLLALLDFKNRITQDPLRVMDSWNDSVHHCAWKGITCDPFNKRVKILALESQKLSGSFPPSIGNLTFLTGINLLNNSFQGEIPQQIGLLSSMKHLNLTFNSFSGNIPSNLSHCTELTFLALEYNQLEGRIPQLSSLSELQYLGLGSNKLTGNFPAWIGNFSSSFFGISLAINSFHGSIPPEIGRLSGLIFFQIYGNQLSGEIPPSVYNLSSMWYFSVTQNQLHGELPPDIGTRFPNIEIFAGGVNNFSGSIPVSLSNCSKLGLIDFANNSFTGTVPQVLGILPKLYRINFDHNKLGSGRADDLNFFPSLTNLSNLQVLGLFGNFFSGELPKSVANLSTKLETLSLGGNQMYGNLPFGIGNLVNLTALALSGNYFTGSIPKDFGKLQNLRELDVTGNEFSGAIPSSLGNLTLLSRLYLSRNRFQGSIPSEFGNLTQLLDLDISDNNLTGTIPEEILSLSYLSVRLTMARNSLSGPLPPEVGKLINLGELDVSDNKLTGEIPKSLGGCLRLEKLIMKSNFLGGRVPESLEALRGLQEIDLSHNNLSGGIPEFFGELPFLEKLDLSFNNFEGEMPNKSIFSNRSVISVAGNSRLCGGAPNLSLPVCSKKKSVNKSLFKARVIIIFVILLTVLTIILSSITAYYVIRRQKLKDSPVSTSEEPQTGISYHEIHNSTNGFSSDNLLGSGSFGSVYKGFLGEIGLTVAVKVLHLHQKGAAKSFIDECRTLKSIRHRNLLKIVTVCSSLDYQGNDFKCLVFELMNKGSLDDWLHPRENARNETRSLDFCERLNIAIDVASALDYLHNYCHTTIVHCDLKPSNILLDDDLTAHVGDFGLAKFLFQAPKSFSGNRDASVELKGSIGYIPPEYGSGGKVSTLGDVYSYGILVLELFTGKRPTNDMFKDGLTLHDFVSMALPNHVMEVADPSLLLVEREDVRNERRADESEESAIMESTDIHRNVSSRTECLVSVMEVGISCSMPLPRVRMPINVAVSKLVAIKELFYKGKKI